MNIIFSLFEQIPRDMIAILYVKSLLKFVRKSQTVFQVDRIILQFYKQPMNAPVASCPL